MSFSAPPSLCFAVQKLPAPKTNRSRRDHRLCCDRFQFQKCSQLFIRVPDETLAAVAMWSALFTQ
jgi:hypothetical protein